MGFTEFNLDELDHVPCCVLFLAYRGIILIEFLCFRGFFILLIV